MTEPTLPDASLWRMSPAARAFSGAPPGPDPLTQHAGIQVLQALAMTQPLRVVDAEMLARSNHSDPGTTRSSGWRQPVTKAGASAPASPQRTTWLGEFARGHGGKLAVFSVIGATVFAFGLALQAMLVREAGIGPVAAYAVQTIICIQAAYVLNRHLTWRGRDVRFWAACARFTVQRVLITIPSLLVYAGLIRLHLGYLWANAVTTTAFTVINYSVGHMWSFASDADADSTSPSSARRLRQTSP